MTKHGRHGAGYSGRDWNHTSVEGAGAVVAWGGPEEAVQGKVPRY